MEYFKVLVSCGHLGNTKEITVTRYFTAKSIIEAFENGNRMPRAKRKHNHSAVLLVKPITQKEYITGKGLEKYNSYLSS
ncbi:hypothetical protein [Sporosalibacterium faouarense]|uniref:hypothetical protein n=1 Tax=Sporosalibacterium faouarense TaxID=516123 RepID=UPI00141D570C|nr:hypothetical protein [Sporosalibacterium faouarense]MTI49103.1 hypothetical protein [Bacillota bacterium]